MADFFSCTRAGSCCISAGVRFGIVDPDDGHMVYRSYINPAACWKSSREDVVVEADIDLTFAPIDHNPPYEAIAVDGSGASEKKCDCFLYSDDRDVIVFIETKKDPDIRYPREDSLTASQLIESDSTSAFLGSSSRDDLNWQDYGVLQLKSTIDRFRMMNPEIDEIVPSMHRAYVANKECDYDVEYATISQSMWMLQETGYLLSVNNFIKIQTRSGFTGAQVLTDGELKGIVE